MTTKGPVDVFVSDEPPDNVSHGMPESARQPKLERSAPGWNRWSGQIPVVGRQPREGSKFDLERSSPLVQKSSRPCENSRNQ